MKEIRSTADNGPVVIKTGNKVILNFEEMQVNGNTGCNTFNGVYREPGNDKVVIDIQFVTKIGCPPVDGSVEDLFLRLLRRDLGYTKRGNRLTIQAKSDFSDVISGELKFVRE